MKATFCIPAPESWAALRSQGRAFVERERTWAHSVARYRGVYGPIVEQARARARELASHQ